MRHVRLRGPVWEPCCGTGAISQALSGQGYTVVSTDIADYGFGTPGIDIFACRDDARWMPVADHQPALRRHRIPQEPGPVIGGHARFRASHLVAGRKRRGQLALLVRLQWIAGKRAATLMSSGPFAAVVVLTRRIRWFDMGDRTNAAQHHHAWVVFDYEHVGGKPPSLLFAE